MLNITCPSCAAEFEIESRRIPKEGATVQCSFCNNQFFVAGSSVNAPAIDDNLPAPKGANAGFPPIPTIPAGATPIITPPDVENLPAPKSSAGAAAMPRITPPGGGAMPHEAADLPAPKIGGGAGMKMPGFEDLPMPKSAHVSPPGISDLPQPKAAYKPQLSDLTPSISKQPGVDNLPTPKGAAPSRGITDLPQPKGISDLPTPKGISDLPQPKGVANLPQPKPSSIRSGLPNLAESPRALDEFKQPANNRTVMGMGAAPPPTTKRPLAIDEIVASGLDDLPLPTNAASASTGTQAKTQLGMGGSTLADLMNPTRPAPSPDDDVLQFSAPTNEDPDQPDDALERAPAATKGATASNRQKREPLVEKTDLVEADTTEGDSEIEPASESKEKSTATPTTKRKGVPRAAIAAGAVAILLVGAGIATGFLTNYGFFGVNLFKGKSKIVAAPPQQLDAARALLRKDSFADYTKAAQEFTAIEKAFPQDPDAKALHAQALLAQAVRFDPQSGTKALAETILNALTTPTAEGEEVPPLTIEGEKAFALKALADQQLDAGMTRLKSLLAKSPNDPQLHVYLGWGYLTQKNFNEAKSAFEKALGVIPDLPAALYGLAQSHFELNLVDEASKHLITLLAKAPYHLGGALLQARLVAKTDPSQAKSLWERVAATKDQAHPTQLVDAHLGLASLAKQDGKNTDARTHYQAALTLIPTHELANLEMGRILYEARQFKEALEAFRKIKNNLDALMMMARTELALGNVQDAERHLRTIQTKAKDQQNKEVPFMLAQIQLATTPLEQKNIDEAIKLFSQAITLDGNYFEPYLHLSRLYIRQNNPTEAFKTLEKAKAILPQSADVLNALGEANLAAKKLEEAQKYFEEAVAINPNLNDALFNLANVLRDQGNEVQALATYEKVKMRDENYPGLAENLARLYFLKRDYAASAASYEKVLAATKEPTLDLYTAAAQAFFAAGTPDPAYNLAEDILKKNPMSDVGRAIKAEALYQQKQLVRAMTEIRVALDRKERSDYYRVLGLIHLAQSEFGDAMAAFESALKLDPAREDIRLTLVELLVKNARANDALTHIKTLLQQNPTLSSAYFYKGKALGFSGREDQAVEAYEMAVTRNPTLAEAHFELGLLYNDRQKVAKALSHFEQAIKHAEEAAQWRPQAYFLVGESSMKLGKKAQAIEAFRTYLKVAPLSAGARDEAKRLLVQLGGSE